MAWVIDLDGVVWLTRDPIPGSADAVAELRAAGHEVVFVTNNAESRVSELEAKLAEAGIEAGGAVITSAQAAASVLDPGSTALACGGPGVVEALEARGITVRSEGPVDAVVVGFHHDFDYARLTAAHRAVWQGARLIGTNADPTLPTPEGPLPGAGSLLAAVATAAGVEPEVAGKPFPPMAALVRQLVGDGPHVMVGDRPSTDGLLAVELGARFGLVLSGTTDAGDLEGEEHAPDRVADDLAAMVAAELGG
ncbi:MAG: HAD-IIA family hydrolase [Actinobacteria bacterium]|nr:HAD-IIA family hydrolase [Actinomycetota bacterium]